MINLKEATNMANEAPESKARHYTNGHGSKKKKRILIVDDHPVLRRGIAALLLEQPDFEICAEAENSATALQAIRTYQPDLILLDISLPGTNGIELTKQILAEQPKVGILVLSMHDESLYALRALKAGAKGYVMKAEAMNYVVAALHKIVQGDIYVSPRFSDRLVFQAINSQDRGMGSPVDQLSDRELEVFQLLGKGSSTRDIAATLHLSVKTIETHRAHIKEKLNFKDASEMIRFAHDWATQEEV